MTRGSRLIQLPFQGGKRQDQDRVFDWEGTPNQPYHPSASDYRIPRSVDPLAILELPMTTAPIQSSQDPKPFLRYLNLAYRVEPFRDGWGALLDAWRPTADTRDHDLFVTTILHPEEIIDSRRDHPLYGFSLQVVERNLDCMLGAIERRGWSYRFARTGDVAESYYAGM